MELKHIDIAKLTVSPANMRARGKASDIANILPSVRARGVLVPLIVRAQACGEAGEGGSSQASDERYEIIAGKRRYHAALAVAEEGGGMEELPCAVIEPGDDAAALEASLIETSPVWTPTRSPGGRPSPGWSGKAEAPRISR